MELLIQRAEGDATKLDELVRDHFHEGNDYKYDIRLSSRFRLRASNKAHGTTAISSGGWEADDTVDALLQKALYVYDHPDEYDHIKSVDRDAALGWVAVGIDTLTFYGDVAARRDHYRQLKESYSDFIPRLHESSRGIFQEWSHAAVIAGKALRKDMKLGEFALGIVEEKKIQHEDSDPRAPYYQMVEYLQAQRQLTPRERTHLLLIMDNDEDERESRAVAAQTIANSYERKLKTIKTTNGSMKSRQLIVPQALKAYAGHAPEQDFLTWMVDRYRKNGSTENFDETTVQSAVLGRIIEDITLLQKVR